MSLPNSAGAALTAPVPAVAFFDASVPLHDGRERPFKARPLRRSEFKRSDVFRFFSCKEDRAVDVVRPYELAFRLLLEFDSQCTAVVERPRRLDVAGRAVELTFWWRERNGREHFALLVPDAETLPGPDGHRHPRHVERLLAAARAAAIDLRLVTEYEVRVREARIEFFFHLLGFVQSAKSLKSDLVLRQEVLAAVGRRARCRVDQLEDELGRFPRTHVHIVIAELIYLGALSTNATQRLARTSLLWRTTV